MSRTVELSSDADARATARPRQQRGTSCADRAPTTATVGGRCAAWPRPPARTSSTLSASMRAIISSSDSGAPKIEGLAGDLCARAPKSIRARVSSRDLGLRLGAARVRASSSRWAASARQSSAARDQFAGVLGGRAGVEAEQAGVGKGPVERGDRIGEAALLAHFLEQARRHAAADRRRRKHARRRGRRSVIGAALEADTTCVCSSRFLATSTRRRDSGRRAAAGGRAGQGGEQRSARVDDRGVIDRAGGGDDHRAGADNGGADRRRSPSRSKPPTVSRRAEDRPADRLVRKGGGVEEVEHEIVGRVLDRADLLQDDVLLALQFVPGRTGCR